MKLNVTLNRVIAGSALALSLMATTAMYPGLPETIDIIGTRGSAHLSGANLEVHFLEGESLTVTSEGGTGSGANIMDFSHGPHREVLIEFMNSIVQQRPPRVNGEDALKTHFLIDELLRMGTEK